MNLFGCDSVREHLKKMLCNDSLKEFFILGYDENGYQVENSSRSECGVIQIGLTRLN